MSFWTPYTPYTQEEVALDLSRTARKTESPIKGDVIGNSSPTFSDYGYQTLPSNQPYFTDYSYPHPDCRVPSASITSDSVGSSPRVTPELYDTESLTDDAEYQEFEFDALRAMQATNGGLLANNPRMRRAVQTSQTADDAYRKQRERNNLAAKQSRDRRKLREVRLALQVRFLTNKVAGLRARLKAGVCKRCHKVCEC